MGKAHDIMYIKYDVQKKRAKLEELMQDQGIIRNRQKLKSAISNAIAFLKIQEEFGSFDKYIWGFTDGEVIDHHLLDGKDMPAKDELSEKISRELKKRGFKFVGPTTIYSCLQGIGIINDHWEYCIKDKGVSYCFECSDNPCKLIKNLEKSYNKRYKASLMENSEFVRQHGLQTFMEQ